MSCLSETTRPSVPPSRRSPEAQYKFKERNNRIHTRHHRDIDNLIGYGVFGFLTPIDAFVWESYDFDYTHDHTTDPEYTVDSLPSTHSTIDPLGEMQVAAYEKTDIYKREKRDAEVDELQTNDFQCLHEDVGNYKEVIYKGRGSEATIPLQSCAQMGGWWVIIRFAMVDREEEER